MSAKAIGAAAAAIIVFTVFPTPRIDGRTSQAATVRPVTPLATVSQSVAFIPNRGQLDPSVRFVGHMGGCTLLVLDRSLAFRCASPGVSQPAFGHAISATTNVRSLNLKFVGGLRPSIEPLHRLPGRANYFFGSDRRAWKTDLPMFAQVEFRNIYRNVDLVLGGSTGPGLRYSWNVRAGGSTHSVVLAGGLGAKASVDGSGRLAFGDGSLSVSMGSPPIYQGSGSAAAQLPGRYVLKIGNRIGIAAAAGAPMTPHAANRAFGYVTVIGGTADDQALAIAVDSSSSAYITGYTQSDDFPFTKPHRNTDGLFVAKLNPQGSALEYATYLGGDFSSEGLAIAVDQHGSAYITGDSYAHNYPTVSAIQTTNRTTCTQFNPSTSCPNVIVTKLTPSGDGLVYSTYLGGESDDEGYGIALAADGSVYVTGRTDSDAFPVKAALQAKRSGTTCDAGIGLQAPCFDAFIAHIDPSGRHLLFSTYFGGTQDDEGYGIALDAQQHVYIAGFTKSTDFPRVNALPVKHSSNYRAFAAELTSDGKSIIYSTLLGGTGEDRALAIAVQGGAAYVTGLTHSSDFPTLHPLQSSNRGFDAFVMKINPGGGSLAYSTYLGGSGDDEADGIAVDAKGDAFVTGQTDSTDFPVVNAAQVSNGGGEDGFLAELSPDGRRLLQSTYIGGPGDEDAMGVAIDSQDNAYVCGFTQSSQFGLAIGPGTGMDAFVAKVTPGTGSSPPPVGNPTPSSQPPPRVTVTRVLLLHTVKGRLTPTRALNLREQGEIVANYRTKNAGILVLTGRLKLTRGKVVLLDVVLRRERYQGTRALFAALRLANVRWLGTLSARLEVSLAAAFTTKTYSFRLLRK